MNTKDNTGQGNKFFEIVTLRDYFAGLAMQGILSNPEDVGMNYEDVVKNSFKIADKMMEARNDQR